MIDGIYQQQFVESEHDREKRLNGAWARYHGYWQKDGSGFGWPQPLKRTKTDPNADDNTRVNLAKLIVNKSVSFLFGFDLDFEVDGEKESPEEGWLEKCLAANRGMTTFHRLGVNGGVCGQAFVKVMRPSADNEHPFPRLVLWDPARVQVRWDPWDYERVLSYTHSWIGVDPRTAQPVAYRQRVERLEGGGWRIVDEQSQGSATVWRSLGEEVWPYSWCPVFTCQNLPCPNEFWGQSDLEDDVLHVNQQLNFALSNLGRIIRVYAHPHTWGSGFNGQGIEVGIGSIAVVPQGGELHNLEMISDLSSSLEYIRGLREAFHEITRMPEVATGKVEDLGQLSGLALKILYGPLVELTDTKRLTYGEMLTQLAARLLEMGGFGEGRKVEPQWPEIVPTDPKGEAETALLLNEVGVSKDTLLSKLGFDPETEAKQKAEEDAKALEQQTTMFDRGGSGPVPGGGSNAQAGSTGTTAGRGNGGGQPGTRSGAAGT